MDADADNFDEFVTRCSRGLLRSAWVLTGDWPSAEDVVQAALVQAWRRWELVCAADSPEAYVRAIVTRQFLRSRRRRWTGEIASDPVPEQPREDAGLADAESRVVLTRYLAALSPMQRAVVLLRYLDDLPEKRVAELLGCSLGSVKRHHARALDRLRRAFDEWQGVNGG